MKDIEQKDIHSLLNSISILHGELTAESLPRRTLAAIENIIPCEIISFDSFAADDKYIQTQWFDNPEMLTPENLEIFAGVFNENPYENPLITKVVHEQKLGAFRLSDFIGRAKFENTKIFQEFYRRTKINFLVGFLLPVAPDIKISCGLAREFSDFSEREMQLLSLISPHINRAVQNTLAAMRHLEGEARLENLLEQMVSAAIVLETGGKIKHQTKFVQFLLNKYFAGEKRDRDGLPETVVRWLNNQNSGLTGEFKLPPAPLKIEAENHLLIVRPIHHATAGEMTILFEEKTRLTPAVLLPLGLTLREAEVLCYLAAGKTDDDIALLCGIKRRTVHKHLERIYRKLGVETRTAALSRAFELLENYRFSHF